MVSTLSPERTCGFPFWMIIAIALLSFFLVLAESWSSVPFWPDADGYTSHIAERRWVAHPPGYPAFVAVGRLLGSFGIPPYLATQCASLALFLGSLPIFNRIFSRFLDRDQALLLMLSIPFCWIPLLISRSGTSHAADFMSVGFLLLVLTSPAFLEGKARSFFLLALALVLCAAFRLTTFIMMAPAVVLAIIWHWRRPLFWLALSLAGITVALLQVYVVWQSGGWEHYSAYASAMAEGNRRSSILLSGMNGATLFNVARSLFWFGLSTLPFLPAIFSGLGCFLRKQPVSGAPLLFAMATSLGSLAATALYLCTHPGYLTPALPGVWTSFAILAGGARNRLPVRRTALLSMFWGLALFLALKPHVPPRNAGEAVANGVLLQYGCWAIKRSLFLTTSEWLIEAGSGELVPGHRMDELEAQKNR